jgi:hypothetical protein
MNDRRESERQIANGSTEREADGRSNAGASVRAYGPSPPRRLPSERSGSTRAVSDF